MALINYNETFDLGNGHFKGIKKYYSPNTNSVSRNRFVSGIYSMRDYTTGIMAGKWPVLQTSLFTHLDWSEPDCYVRGSNTVNDLTSNNYTFTATGGTYQTYPGGGSLRVYNKINIPLSSGNYAFGSADFTVEMVIQPITQTNGNVIWTTTGSNTAGCAQLNINLTGVSFAFFNGSTRPSVTVSTGDFTYDWAYIAAGRSSGTFRLLVVNGSYPNGLSNSLTTSVNITGGSPRLFANSANLAECFNGHCAIYRVYNRYLTDAECLSNWHAQRQRFIQ